MQVVERLLVCVRTGLSVYAGITVAVVLVYSGLLFWFVSGLVRQRMLVAQWLLVCVREGPSVYVDCTVAVLWWGCSFSVC